MKATKLYAFQDQELDNQVSELVSTQFLNNREVDITFTAAALETKVDVGFLADRFIVVDKSADIRIYRTKSDNKFTYFKASGAGTVTVMLWKGGN